MELELVKKALIEVKNILKIIDANAEIKEYFIDDRVINGELNASINYFDFNDEKNTLFKNIHFEIALDEMKAFEIYLKEVNAYIVEGLGVELEYKLIAKYEAFFDKKIDIIELDEADNKEKIKNKIENDYEKKLSESLVERDNNERIDNKVIITKDVKDEDDFIKYFDKEASSYFCIKTIECRSDRELDKISKEYKIPLDELIKGYDRDNGKVIFRIR